eukprot:scaffold89533_cov16-Tisochrysis_lutea.AAC.1
MEGLAKLKLEAGPGSFEPMPPPLSWVFKDRCVCVRARACTLAGGFEGQRAIAHHAGNIHPSKGQCNPSTPGTGGRRQLLTMQGQSTPAEGNGDSGTTGTFGSRGHIISFQGNSLHTFTPYFVARHCPTCGVDSTPILTSC